MEGPSIVAGHEVFLSISIAEGIGLCRGVLVVGADDSPVVLAGETDRLILLAQISRVEHAVTGNTFPGHGRWW